MFFKQNQSISFLPPDAGSGSGDGGKICLFIYLKTYMWILFLDVYLRIYHYRYLRQIHVFHLRKEANEKVSFYLLSKCIYHASVFTIFMKLA